MVPQNAPLGRFIQAAVDVASATVVVTTTAALSMGSTCHIPEEIRILFPMMDAGAALLLGYRMGEWETVRLLRKRRGPGPQP